MTHTTERVTLPHPNIGIPEEGLNSGNAYKQIGFKTQSEDF